MYELKVCVVLFSSFICLCSLSYILKFKQKESFDKH